ncbi:hypothetical protein AAVH_15198 [Aphelenchoides avenae]|nr:hypothetical protein AAVH_15198 [Aphelenchus avenae]
MTLRTTVAAVQTTQSVTTNKCAATCESLSSTRRTDQPFSFSELSAHVFYADQLRTRTELQSPHHGLIERANDTSGGGHRPAGTSYAVERLVDLYPCPSPGDCGKCTTQGTVSRKVVYVIEWKNFPGPSHYMYEHTIDGTVEFASGKNTVRIRMYDPMQDTERRSQKFQRPYLKEFVKRIKEQYGEEFHTELPDENIDTKPSKRLTLYPVEARSPFGCGGRALRAVDSVTN